MLKTSEDSFQVDEANTPRVRNEEQIGSSTEDAFYSDRSWGFDPVPTVQELFRRLNEELRRLDHLPRDWQREEATRNLFLFVCAVGCTVDDLLTPQAPDLSRLAAHAPKIGTFIRSFESAWRTFDEVRRQFLFGNIARWREGWTSCVDEVSTLIAAETHEEPSVLKRIRGRVDGLTKVSFPPEILNARMTVPTGLLSQDLTEKDALILAERFVTSNRGRGKSLLVVGPRTVGAYFAPLVSAYFRLRGWHSKWLTMRPKSGVTSQESRQLRTELQCGPHVVVVDDHPETGKTMTLLMRILREHGVRVTDMTLLVPLHPVNPRWRLVADDPEAARVATITLAPEEGSKARFLDSPEIESLMREYCLKREGETLHLKASPELDELNARLAGEFGSSFKVRRKRVYEIEHSRAGAETESFRVLAKSVGCGWLSYPAYFAGKRMKSFVPEVFGLRHGLLFQKWVEGDNLAPSDGATPSVRAALVAYSAERSARLALTRDPYDSVYNQAWSGWDVLSRALAPAYDARLRRFAVRRLQVLLRQYASPCPTFIDGNMLPCDWIRTTDGLQKVDFASHAFGKTELNVCDPAHDLAMVFLTFELSPAEKVEMISTYQKLTGDTKVEERLILHKILYTAQQINRANDKLQKQLLPAEHKAWHYCAMHARDSMASLIEEFCVGRRLSEGETEWASRLFFMDLDGVLYKWRGRYPIVTSAGLTAVERLRAHGFSILPNSRRGVEAVKRCCKLYGFSAGVAEFGSVLLDLKRNREIELASKEALEEIAHCRQELGANDEMLLDPNFRYSIRVMRIEGTHTRGLSATDTADLLKRNGCCNLTFLTTPQDTYITDKEVNKGTAVFATKRILSMEARTLFAIGDSEEDLPMLAVGKIGYITSQASPAVKRKARALGCRVLSQPAQRGLAEAVDNILGAPGRQSRTAAGQRRRASSSHLLDELLEIADWPAWRQLLYLSWGRTRSLFQKRSKGADRCGQPQWEA
jgi:hydroxymethylpyrimidine pyrophosphatase-like HAD family hydrolase/adenine/guanine phosphoribosyltransferase-like PRPP-binding protein